MTTAHTVIRLEPAGPAGVGLARMDLNPADFQSPLPEQFLHLYFADEDLGLTVGVWTTTTMQEAFGPYPGDEFMVVLEGRVDMLDGNDKATPVETGQCFQIRNGIPVSWKQQGFLRKFFMTYLDPKAETPKIESADGGVLVLDAAALEPGMAAIDGTDPFEGVVGNPTQRMNNLFTNDAGNFHTGMWDTTAFESAMHAFPVHEFVHMLEGSVTITEQDGTVHTFGPGDSFFTPQGTVCSWKVTDHVKKFYAILDLRG